MEATVAERGQITLPKAVRDALGLTKGSKLKVELEGGRIVLRKDVDDAISQAARPLQACRTACKSTDEAMRGLARPRARRPVPTARRPQMIAVDSSVLLDILTGDAQLAAASAEVVEQALGNGGLVVCDAVVAEVQTMLAHQRKRDGRAR